MKPFVALLTASLLASCGKESSQAPKSMTGEKYKVGQVWNYHTRAGEEKSRLFIVRTEPNEKLGTIYHIHVDGVRLKNPHAASGSQEELPHSPVSAKTLDESVTTLLIEKAPDLPDISEGYAAWREAFDQGNGGVFSIPVKDIVQYVEDIVNGKSDKN